jgi:hypothetical protein
LAAPEGECRGFDRHRLFSRAGAAREKGCFDLFFIADTPAAHTNNLHAWSRFPMFMNVLEPVILLTGLAGATTHIGLGGTVSTSFSEPYNVARQFASLDHIYGIRGTTTPSSTTARAVCSSTRASSTRSITRASSSRSTARSTSPARRRAIR